MTDVKTVYQRFAGAVARTPRAPALADRRRTLDYAELAAEAADFARAIEQRGVRSGEPVGIVAESGIAPLVALLGSARLGAISVLVGAQAPNQDQALAMSGARVVFRAGLLEAHSAAERLELPPSLGCILFTSGSTGLPRGVAISAEALGRNAAATADLLGLEPNDVVVSLLSVETRLGLGVVLAGLALGAATRLPEGLLGADGSIADGLLSETVTGLACVPTQLRVLLLRGLLSSSALPRLRWARVGAGAVTEADVTRLAAAHPGCKLKLTYGLTEAGEVTHQGGEDLLGAAAGRVGRPLPDVRLAIVDDEGRSLPTGTIGEVALASPRLLSGYLDGGSLPAAGELRRTGDLGRLDEQGVLWLSGRRKHIIKVGGESVAAATVEHALAALPGVNEAVVVPCPDPLLGETPVAFVTTLEGNGFDAAGARAELARRLPRLWVPRQVHVVDELPRLPSGKTDRERLAARAARKEETR